MTDNHQRHFRRLLLALDSAGGWERALDVAADVAVGLEAELAGLFVEDRDLLRLASLPFGEEIALTGAASRRLDRATVKQELKGQAVRARRHLQRVALHRRLAWSFEVRRGQPWQELRGLAEPDDLVSLSTAAYTLSVKQGGCFRLGAGLPAFLVLDERDRLAQGPVAVLLDGSPCALQVLQVAARLAAVQQRALRLLPWCSDPQVAQARVDDARRRLPTDLPVETLPVVAPGSAGRLRRLLLQRLGFLVVPACIDLEAPQLDQLHRALGCPLLVMAET